MCLWPRWYWAFWSTASARHSGRVALGGCGGWRDKMLMLALLLVPVATAAASFFARRRAAMEALNLAGFGVVFLVAVALAARVLAAGTVSLANGFFYADALSALVVLLTASVALVC